MQITRLMTVFLSSMICIACSTSMVFAATIGVKSGVAASSFYYTDKVMDPYLGFDIDLRPYLGYDIGWAQLGEQKPLIAPLVSCYLDYRLTDRLFLRPEIGITQKGVVFNQHSYERVVYEVKITYLRVPLSLGYQVWRSDRVVADLYLGGAGALRLDAYKNVADHNSQVRHHSLDNVSNCDFSLLLGFDFKWKLFDRFFLFDVQSFFGLINVFHPIETQAQLYHRTQETKNAGLFLSLGYEFTK